MNIILNAGTEKEMEMLCNCKWGIYNTKSCGSHKREHNANKSSDFYKNVSRKRKYIFNVI